RTGTVRGPAVAVSSMRPTQARRAGRNTKSFDSRSYEPKFTTHVLGAKSVLDPRARFITSAITVTVQIPGSLRDCCAGAAELGLSATSLRGVLDELERRHPA